MIPISELKNGGVYKLVGETPYYFKYKNACITNKHEFMLLKLKSEKVFDWETEKANLYLYACIIVLGTEIIDEILIYCELWDERSMDVEWKQII